MSKILVARSADLGFVKVVGKGNFQNSSCLKAFYLQLLKEGVRRFVVDLNACTYLDSTFLGILLHLGLKLKEAGNGRFLHVLNASPRNLELFKNLGLDRLIHVDGPGGPGLNGLDSGPSSPVGPIKGGNGTGPLDAGASKINLNGVTDDQLQEMVCPTPTKVEAGPTILEAHEALMEFDPRNVPKFKDVVEFLREDLGHPAR